VSLLQSEKTEETKHDFGRVFNKVLDPVLDSSHHGCNGESPKRIDMAGSFVVILTVRVATVSEVDRSVCGVCIGGQEEGGQKKHFSHGGHPAKEKTELQAVKLETDTEFS
jgi:hypothetical protein